MCIYITYLPSATASFAKQLLTAEIMPGKKISMKLFTVMSIRMNVNTCFQREYPTYLCFITLFHHSRIRGCAQTQTQTQTQIHT